MSERERERERAHPSLSVLLSLQRPLPELCGDRVPDRPAGHRQGHRRHAGPQRAALSHRGPVQSDVAGNHADGQPAQVRLVFYQSRSGVRQDFVAALLMNRTFHHDLPEQLLF